MRNSFIELKARGRAEALLDNGSFYELLGPFDQIESPHLVQQGIVPESDDGMIIARGQLNGTEALILSIEGAFQGGGIGEVCGSKIAGALERVLLDNKSGKKVVPIIIFDTGGVRLQEANYGLLIISEIQAAIVALREYIPVIALIPGNVGCFGGMSITAALCSHIIMTETARFGLNGPEVIEQEAGVQEFNSRDRSLIWSTIGGKARLEMGLIDSLVIDDVDAFKEAIIQAIATPNKTYRTQQTDRYLSFIDRINPSVKNIRNDLVELLKLDVEDQHPQIANEPITGKGRTWFNILTNNAPSLSVYPTVLVADTEFEGMPTRFIAVVNNGKRLFPRTLHGEVGLQEGWAVGKYVREAVNEDSEKMLKRNIIAIIDVPSQAYGYNEELAGIHYACASGVDAYATARLNGHKTTGLIVGNAISGAFLTHGLQCSRLIAIDDTAINIQAMSKQSAARITKRTIAELEAATQKVPAMAYDVKNYNKLGPLDALVECENTEQPTQDDQLNIIRALASAVLAADNSLSHRLETPNALSNGRKYSRLVREKISEQWI